MKPITHLTPKGLSSEAVKAVIATFTPLKHTTPREIARVLEREAEAKALKYFRSVDPSASCTIIITDSRYCIYVHVKDPERPREWIGYSYYSDYV